MKIHICPEQPCPVSDEEIRERLTSGFAVHYAKDESEATEQPKLESTETAPNQPS